MGSRRAMVRPMVALASVACVALTLPEVAAEKVHPLEFDLDEHTLLLAHFNETPREADYAMGWKEFGGSGASLAEGYFGKALDTRGLQYSPDFWETGTNRTPRFNYWGFWPRGNVDFYQGTLEFWFRVSPDDLPQNHARQSIFFTHWYQPVIRSFNSTYLTRSSMTWAWHTLSGEKIEGKVQFSPPLDPDRWHHYAMCWSPGEFVIYIDGRAADARDMTAKEGLALVAQPHKSVVMNGALIDELRISNIVRHAQDFEPPWRDGLRPGYAFQPAEAVQRYPGKTEERELPALLAAPATGEEIEFRCAGMSLLFDRQTGFLTRLGSEGKRSRRHTDGVRLWQGVERTPLQDASASDWQRGDGKLSFRQTFGDTVELRYELTERDEALRWSVTFRNLTPNELWLEALLSVSLPFGRVTEYFDMSYIQDELLLPRRRDEYVFSLPFVAAASADEALGVGIDPHTGLSALISEWVPEADRGTVRQGTRVVLDPRDEYALPFVIVNAEADFGVLNAMDRYHSLLPDLYRQRPDVPIYSYMPVCRYFEHLELPELARLCYNGMQWGHGPGHGKGDEWGTPRYWEMPKDPDRPDHAYTLKLEKVWGSLEGMREQFLLRSKRSYDNYYTLRRSHYLPNWANRYIVEDIWPEGMMGGDTLVAGQYYEQMYYANEHNTPLGEHYKGSTLNIMKHIGHCSPGFINDMCQTSPMRFTDEIARRTPGRAFSRDRGTYLVGAFGHVDRYELINSFEDERGFRQSIWSDGGVVSYMLLAHSAAAAIESYMGTIDLTGPELGLKAGRYLLGEKPYAVHYSKENEWMGRYYRPDQFTPAKLRDYYRYCFAQALLMALRHGLYLPHDCIAGRQEMMELNPILVESIVLGRKLVPAARVDEPLFVRRAGEGLESFMAVGNEQAKAITSSVALTNRYFRGRPIFGAYFGGTVEHQITEEQTTLPDVTVQPRSVQAFKIIGRLHGEGEATVTSELTGDGLSVGARVGIEMGRPAQLELGQISPIYRRTDIRVNGIQQDASTGVLDLPAGRTVVEVQYRALALAFTADEWAACELLKDGQPSFCLVADTSSDFDKGTAGMLNLWLEQYDAEDGVWGNLEQAPLGDTAPEDFDGWRVIVDSGAEVEPSRVRIIPGDRAVRVEGKTPGEARRAMVVWLRLLDRKYPHIGRLFPLKYDHTEPWGRLKTEETRQFFQDFSDPEFLIKPILHRDLEPLYANGNMDFEGIYDLRWSPYILEPTYADDYVYGYRG